ncbi:Cyclin-L1-1 [Platanthera guangdongensis]|uniref:Cyclin-L1-1 n=1 Tax=Platanthera guangdongensis TaxID=2320717 RepID=A0ABR2MPF1_9ASPA
MTEEEFEQWVPKMFDQLDAQFDDLRTHIATLRLSFIIFTVHTLLPFRYLGLLRELSLFISRQTHIFLPIHQIASTTANLPHTKHPDSTTSEGENCRHRHLPPSPILISQRPSLPLTFIFDRLHATVVRLLTYSSCLTSPFIIVSLPGLAEISSFVIFLDGIESQRYIIERQIKFHFGGAEEWRDGGVTRASSRSLGQINGEDTSISARALCSCADFSRIILCSLLSGVWASPVIALNVWPLAPPEPISDLETSGICRDIALGGFDCQWTEPWAGRLRRRLGYYLPEHHGITPVAGAAGFFGLYSSVFFIIMIYTAINNFYITDEELKNSPSRKDGIDEATETMLRIYGPQAVMATGQVLFHRFYCKKSFARFSVKVMLRVSCLSPQSFGHNPTGSSALPVMIQCIACDDRL